MDRTNHKGQNAKFLVLYQLSMSHELSIDRAEELAQRWLAEHPETSWDTLGELLATDQVIYQQGVLADVPRLTPAQINLLVEQMRGTKGIDIRDRWDHFRLYRKCFIGYEAVQWLIKSQNISKQEALKLGQTLIEAKVFHHVHDEHDFEDDYLFYRFYLDEE